MFYSVCYLSYLLYIQATIIRCFLRCVIVDFVCVCLYVLFVLICWYWSQQYVVFSGVCYLRLFVGIEVNMILSFLVYVICAYLLVLKSTWHFLSGMYYLWLFVSIEVNKLLSLLVCIIYAYLLVLKSTWYCPFCYVLFVFIY